MGATKEAGKTITSGVYMEGRKKVRDLDGLAYIAMLDAVMEHLGIMKDKAIAEMEPELFAPYWDEVQNDGVHELTSYIARDNGFTGKVEFARKRSDVALKPDEIRKLTSANITLPAPSGPKFVIKSEYVKDDAVIDTLQKLIELGEKHNIELPGDFIEPANPKVTMNKEVVMDALSLDWQKAYGLLPVLGKVNVKDCALSPKVPVIKALREVLAKVSEAEKATKAAA